MLTQDERYKTGITTTYSQKHDRQPTINKQARDIGKLKRQTTTKNQKYKQLQKKNQLSSIRVRPPKEAPPPSATTPKSKALVAIEFTPISRDLLLE